MSSPSALLVAIVATLGLCGSSDAFITNDTYFYGQSPTVPSPAITGTGDWATAYAKATAFVSQLTLDEKINMTYGIPPTTGCSGQIPAITRLNFSGLCLTDAGNGVRATDFVSGFASGLSVGASFNKNLAYQRGLAMGGEFQKKGVNVALGPVVGPLGRIAEGGRNWEGFANDPYLSGKLAAESVKGVQERGVITSLKHFIGNEQETNRNPFANSSTNVITESTSSNIDDKTIHELYLWPFADAIREGTANVMCSYNRLNNSYACQNSKSLNGLLKTELGFQGFVVSDWYAQHSGVASTLGGLDMVMPNGGAFWGAQSTLAIQNGTVPMSRLDDQVTRIMAAWYKLGQDSPSQLSPGAGMPLDLTKPHTIVDARDPAARTTIMDGAIEGHVLVKNTGSLPLKSPRQLSIFGYDAQIFDVYNPQPASVSIFQDASWVFSLEGVNQSLITPGFLGAPPVPSTLPQIAINGTMISGGGSGGNTPSYVSAPFTALSQRAMEDGTSLFWDFESQDPNVAGSSDACLVFINAFASEGIDRPGIADTYSDTLVNNVADKCNNTIVIIHNAGVRLVDRFVDHPNVTALVYAHVPGQDSGLAITRLLYGDASFSGKLPYTVARNESDYGALLEPSLASGDFTLFPQDNFSEGVYIDYRHFDKYNITPRYEFGFGLSYTTFAYSNLSISAVKGANTQPYPAGPILQGGQQDLWDVLYQVQATVTNTGSCAGAEVAQLYINVPGGPIRQLRGFSKVGVPVGKSSRVEFDVMRRDLSEWDVGAQMWKLQRGAYAVSVGASSRILPLTGMINI